MKSNISTVLRILFPPFLYAHIYLNTLLFDTTIIILTSITKNTYPDAAYAASGILPGGVTSILKIRGGVNLKTAYARHWEAWYIY